MLKVRDQRIRATPITEAATAWRSARRVPASARSSIGAGDFCFFAMDQIVNQAAKIHYMFGGQ